MPARPFIRHGMSLKTVLSRYVKEPNTICDSCHGSNYFYYMVAYRNYLIDMLFLLPALKNKKYFGDVTSLVNSLSFQIDKYLKTKLMHYVIEHEKSLLESSGLLRGNSSREKEHYYIIEISNTEDWIQYIFEKYPRLERLIEVYTNNTLDYINKILSDFSNDREFLKPLGVGGPERIVDIELFMGDFHCRGRFVSKVVFENDFSLMYKPRVSENESVLTDLLNTINCTGLKVDLRVPSYVQVGNHSWFEFLFGGLRCKEFNPREYYNNMGRVLSVLYAIGASDIIPDNIMVIDGLPVLIDLECVHHERFFSSYLSYSSNYFNNSVISVGILPVWKYSSMNERNTLSSALFRFGNNFHLPFSDGEYQEISSDYTESFLAGFKETYIKLNSLDISSFIKRFGNCKQRLLIHDTSLYSYLQREMLLPEFLSGESEILDLINKSIPDIFSSCYKALSDSIYEQLLNNDIPLFYISPDGFILDGYNNIITSINSLSTKTIELSENDLVFQCKVIESSIGQALESFKPRPSFLRPTLDDSVMSEESSSDCYLRAAKMTVEEIYKKCLHIGGEINWVAKNTSLIDGRYQADVLDESLYSGTAGMSELFAQMYRVTGDSVYKMLSEELFTTIKKQFYKEMDKDSIPIARAWDFPLMSYHYFPVCGIYLLCRNKVLFDQNKELIEDIIHYIKVRYMDRACDCGYLGGLAGYLDILIELKRNGFYNVPESEIIEVYNKLISNEIIKGHYSLWPHSEVNSGEKSSLALGGFSHGSSGIAYVLYKLYKMTGDNDVYDKFVRTLNYDRSFFESENKGWKDGRLASAHHDMGAWCHGAGGIGLSRALLFKEGYRDESIMNELRCASSVLFKHIGDNQCVCHGDSGNLEILKIIGEILNDMQMINNVHSKMNELAYRILTGKDLIFGDGRTLPTLGLFLGESGVAYQMLRFAKWDDVPSILFLDFSKHK